MVRGIANSKIGFGDLILLLRYFFKLKVSTHPNKFNDFINIYRVQFPKTDEFGSSTIALKTLLLGCKAAQNSPHVKRDNYGDADIVSFAKSLGEDAIVLTSETVFKLLDWNNPKHKDHIKVPNLCALSGVQCLNWFGLLDYLGQKY